MAMERWHHLQDQATGIERCLLVLRRPQAAHPRCQLLLHTLVVAMVATVVVVVLRCQDQETMPPETILPVVVDMQVLTVTAHRMIALRLATALHQEMATMPVALHLVHDQLVALVVSILHLCSAHPTAHQRPIPRLCGSTISWKGSQRSSLVVNVSHL